MPEILGRESREQRLERERGSVLKGSALKESGCGFSKRHETFSKGSEQSCLLGRKVLAFRKSGHIIGAGRSTIYKVLETGELAAVKLGRRTIILKRELLRFLSELPAANFGIKQPDALVDRSDSRIGPPSPRAFRERSTFGMLWASPQPDRQAKGQPSNGPPFSIPCPSPPSNGVHACCIIIYPPRHNIRHRCRNLRCGSLLKNPTDDRMAAFCCEPCERAHFATRCIVCEAAIAKASRRRTVCWRSKCRHALQRHPGKYRLRVGQNAAKTVSAIPTAGLGHNAQENSAKSTQKTSAKSGRGYRIIAGPAADPINFENWPDLPKPRLVLIGRTTPPVNVIGGFKFPGAPKIDLGNEGQTLMQWRGAAP